MTGKPFPKVRRNLFRAIALERYRGPIEFDIPHVLPRWHPWLVVAAVAVGLAVAMLWI